MQCQTNNKLSFKTNLGYSMGNLGSNLIFQMTTTFMLFFYTDVFGITAAAAGTLFLVARIWDAVNDPMMGSIVDKTNTRWGRFRPYILFGTIPCAIFYMLTFYTPDISPSAKLIYAYVTYILLGMSVTLVNIPYHSLSTLITKDPTERGDVGAVSSVTCGIAILVVSSFTMPLVMKFSTPQVGFSMTTVIFGAVMIITYFISFFSTKAYDTKQEVRMNFGKEEKQSFSERLKVITGNRPLIMLMLSYLFFQFGGGLFLGTAVYYFKYVRETPAAISGFFAIVMTAFILGTAIVPPMIRKFGKKNTFLIGNILGFVGYIALYFFYNGSTSVIMAAAGIVGICTGIPTALVWGMLPDTVEYAEWKTGNRSEGLIFASLSFMMKLASALAGAFAGFALEMANYVPNVAQVASAKSMILILAFLAPALSKIVVHFLMSKYELTEERFYEITHEISSRKIAS